MSLILSMLQTCEFWLSISLFIGVGINLFGAWNFFCRPKKSAQDLGMVLGDEGHAQTQATLILMRLAGVCLVALAIFYLVTALGPVEQAWSVVAAVLTRASGAVFYAWTLAKAGGPRAFKTYLGINLLLAIAHGVLLVSCPEGVASLQKSWNAFYWVAFFQSRT
ncbi:MAG: hypothetical protein IT423_19135 [Pirellulaceae bacterium]|nr:hypothetical protein [Pirellulaceae bacterium]